MSSSTDSEAIVNYHRSMISAFGQQSSHALGWRDTQSQLIRFKVLAGIADLNNRSVLDAGSGHSDLLPYLQQMFPALGDYCGVEQIPELLRVAIRRFGHLPAVSFVPGNFITDDLPVMDFVIASGSLNYASADAGFIYKAIAKLYDSCNIGLGFNLLRDIPVNGLLATYDPEDIVSFCKTLSENVVLICDYDDEDFTVFMYR